MKNKMFIVRKYVMALNAKQALKRERHQDADDVWIDEDWKKGENKNLAASIGFTI